MFFINCRNKNFLEKYEDYELLYLIGPLSLGRISAGSTFMLLNMIGAASASSAQSMSLIVLLTEAGGSLRHLFL